VVTLFIKIFIVSSFLLLSSFALALDEPKGDIEHIRVKGDTSVKDGEFISASQGWVSGDTLIERPMLRAGEILEFIPGMMVTQHSGSGKANQYFLRGFNLDHGTDFTVSVDGMPINMRSHGHGQGYSDLNFVITEFIDNLSYFKGTYYANIGDFSSAGGAFFKLKDSLQVNQLFFGLGEYGFKRTVALNQFEAGANRLITAL